MRLTGTIENCLVCNKEFYVPAWWKSRGAKYCSKKCYWINKHDVPWNKGTKGLIKQNGGCFAGSEVLFKGTIKEYKALHYRIGKKLGKPQECSLDKTHPGPYHWANKSGEYSEDLTDWIRLCTKCHFVYDKQGERRIKNI